jgi:hypothetical protein
MGCQHIRTTIKSSNGSRSISSNLEQNRDANLNCRRVGGCPSSARTSAERTLLRKRGGRQPSVTDVGDASTLRHTSPCARAYVCLRGAMPTRSTNFSESRLHSLDIHGPPSPQSRALNKTPIFTHSLQLSSHLRSSRITAKECACLWRRWLHTLVVVVEAEK